jgi:hypothetical protein
VAFRYTIKYDIVGPKPTIREHDGFLTSLIRILKPRREDEVKSLLYQPDTEAVVQIKTP